MAIVLAGGLMFSLAGTARAQYGAPLRTIIRVRPSPQIFATLCALYAAGYPVLPADAPPQLRDMVVRLGALKGPSVTALQQFYNDHRLPTNSATLARYLSFGMVIGPPPTFPFVLPQEELPPDVRDLAGFRKVLADFYASEHVGDLWNQVEPYYQARAARLRGPVSQIVTDADGYARRMKRFAGDRTFTVYVDPLIGVATNFRIYSESYEIAVNPSSGNAITDIRHAFLHFLLDPLPFNNLALVESKAYLLNFAVEAPRLPEEYKREFVAFTDECFIRAVQLRLGSLSPAARQAALKRNDRDGYILVRPLYNGLKQYESSADTLSEYFPKLIESIDVKKIAARDQHISFAPANGPAPVADISPADRTDEWIQEGDRQIAIQDAKGAVATFQRVLQLEPGNARAQYGLAVASILTGKTEQARKLFEKVVNSRAADPSVAAWSHVYLGRMSDVAGERQSALAQYRKALAISGIPAMAREAAEQGIKKPFAAPESASGKTPQP